MLLLYYINSKGEPLAGGFHIPCHSPDDIIQEAEQYFSQGKRYVLRDSTGYVTVISHKWHHLDDVYYAKLETQ